MSLKDVYQRFLANPQPAALAPDASLIYITTTTKLDGASAVLSHLAKQQKIVKTRSEIVLDAIESANSLCLDIETTLEFNTGGGAYLPSLDDNFLADHVATFPTIHIVRFNAQNQIQNVRIYWEQASLLKQVEVIGSRSRGWPIRDTKDQIRLIKSAIASAPTDKGPGSANFPAYTERETETGEERSKKGSPGKRYIKDPHAADSLFELLSPGKEGKDRSDPVRAPRAPASGAPPPREYGELFVEDENAADAPDVTPSRTKPRPKSGAIRKFQPSRLFDDDETVAAEKSHEQIAYRANPKRFDHFELGADNSTREIKEKPQRPQSRQAPHWDFDDVTPEKPKRQPRGEEVRHFGWSDDEPDLTSPPVRPKVVQPRPDAETHFELADVQEDKGPRIISSYQNKGLGLYKNHLFSDSPQKESAPPANNAANMKEFASHWSVTDSPQDPHNDENSKPVPGDRQQALKMMQPNWKNTYDQSSPAKMTPPQRRSMRNANQRHWGVGEN
ncbi:hypothetical protein BO70DRAFT_285266 [Aspergillus heteromorphus CBS 117.55]|uniref:NTF2-like protein n=1 Tax=Aspergillus heteromorphus CBS 117.55 TaxID=1448321 RepID=A0A317WVF7_9EURO|nr:uncharacterized protein BO70DRAFT_285266 [Aspergillus heteromorphus CBS 117.55]PWY89282.1 hypothetical protein BO70DRAFT_285266 [Aspergillus heteromorphus CBS 117.55]